MLQKVWPKMSTRILQDRFGRRIDYLRLSVTDRCDLRCSYCLPERFTGYNEPADWLTFDEIERVAKAFVNLGVSRIRLTGGEPLTRRNLPQLARRISLIQGLEDLSLSTNGTQLFRYANDLKESGISRLNVSLDTLDKKLFADIAKRDCLEDILKGIVKARDVGFKPIKINMVVMAGLNSDEIDKMVGFCIQNNLLLRLIETMPMGTTGQQTSYLNLQPIKDRLKLKYNLCECLMDGGGPAVYLQSSDKSISIGFITPISQHFCESCNRVRLSADGTLYMCLGQDDNISLRDLLRNGCSDKDLEHSISNAIELKPLKHEFIEKPNQVIRFMSATGG